MTRKSYWQSMISDSDRAKDAIKSWFSPLADDMTPYKAEVLCDIETDAERKLRMFATDKNGHAYVLVRTKTVKGFNLSMKRLPSAPPAIDTPGARQ